MELDPDLVRDRVAVVTGASRGIGAGLAERFHDLGMRLGLCARSEPVLAGSDGVVSASVDVTDSSAVVDFAATVADELGSIDLWVNNAGLLEPMGPLADTDPADVQRLLDVNVMGVVHGTRAFVHHRRVEGGGGVCLNLTSGAAKAARFGWAPYSASKAAVDRISEAVALEEAEHGIRVYAVAPGVVESDMQRTIRSTDEAMFPDQPRFVELHERGAFNSTRFVADWFAAIAFDPDHRPDEVVVRLPDEGSGSD